MSDVEQMVTVYHGVFSAPEQHRQFAMLKAFASDRENPVVIELGGGDGISTVMFLSGGADVWSVDILDVRKDWTENYHFLKADDLSLTAQEFLPSECDVLFIDSAHTRVHTLMELNLYGHRVRPGGVIVCHDTHFSQDGGELPEPTGEVADALTEWCEANNLTWVDYPGSFGLGVVKIGEADDSVRD
jgi:predicted O-methyltransferase YrrM